MHVVYETIFTFCTIIQEYFFPQDDFSKNLTFHFATQSGVSLSVEDLRVPAKKRELIGLTRNEVETTQKRYEIGSITSVEKFQNHERRTNK